MFGSRNFFDSVKVNCTLVVIAVILATRADIATAQTIDRVRLNSGQTETGEVTSMTDTNVQIKVSTTTKTIPVNEIRVIHFDQEPIELTQARVAVRSGAYREALDALAKVELRNVGRPEVRHDVEFYTALAKARLALSNGDHLLEGGQAVNDFVTRNRRNFHYYEAVEVLGDVLAAMGRFEQAATQYAALEATPWPDYKIRAGLLEGRALAAQGKHQEAIDRFDTALKIESDAPAVAAQRLAARLEKAESQAELGQADAAIQAVEQIIVEADPEAVELQARAHNVLGRCYLKANAPKDALYSFLYVDVLCGSVAEAHAEALFHLIELYRAVGREEDARQDRQRLLEHYPQSKWARKLQEG